MATETRWRTLEGRAFDSACVVFVRTGIVIALYVGLYGGLPWSGV